MAQTNYTPIQLYFSTTASAVPTAANLAQGELAINITDGKLYYEDNSGTVQVIATKGAGTIGGSTTQIQYNNAGALAGNAAMVFNNSTNVITLTTLNLTNPLGTIYGGTGLTSYTTGDLLYSSASNTLAKLAIGTANYILTVNSGGTNVQWSAPSSISVSTATNLAGGVAGSVPYQSGASTTTFLGIGAADRVMTSSGTAPQWVTSLTGLTGVSSSSITNTSLTSGRVVFSGASGLESDSASLTFNGTTLSAGGFSTTGLSTLVQTVKIGDSNFSGVAVFAPATPAKLYIGTGTVTDATSAIGAINATGAISSLAITPIAATNTSVTYTDAATLYIAGAPSAGTNITLTNPYALYIAAGANFFGGNSVISVTDNTNAALRITQLGTGNALLVEDSANPDATPFVINANGEVIVGYTATVNNWNGAPDSIAISSTASNARPSVGLINWSSNTARSPSFNLYKSVSNTIGTQGIVGNLQQLGRITFSGDDGVTFIRGAEIDAFVDGTPGLNDMPGGLRFLTTADGASTPTERVRIDSVGAVGISATPAAGDTLRIAKNITGATSSYGVYSTGVIQSGVTTLAANYASAPSTAAASFTLANLRHFAAEQGTIGASSSITNQVGFFAGGSLVGGTNNYGFYSNIASGTGRWNFYANNTATNFFGGNTIVEVTDNTNAALRITQLGTGNALLVEDSANPDSTPFVVTANGTIGQGTTSPTTTGFLGGMVSTSATAFAPQLVFQNTTADTSGAYYILEKSRAGAIVSSGDTTGTVLFRGYDGANYIPAALIQSFVDGTPGTNDMPGRLVFSTTANGASTSTERMRIDSSGNVLVTNAAGLGYGTGAGGAVTQLTSRTTGVTLSKPSGAITMFSAAGSAIAATFTVTNTLVAATDTIILNQKSGTNLYVLLVTAVAAGSFNVTFYTTGGVATDAPVINFSLIKGVTA
jgi:hypothetical protein